LEFKVVLRGALALLCCMAAIPAAANPESSYFGPRLIEEQLRVPVDGGRRSVAATVLRPEGPGPYGVIVLNHGVPVSDAERLRTSAADFQATAPIFARRGYVVVMPMRRGFGATGGSFAEDAGPCSNPDYERGERAAAEDVMAAYEYAQGLPYVDPARMILAGQSAGAMAALFAAGARAPKGLVAVLTFAGGRGGNPSLSPGTPCAIEPLARLFDMLGKSVRAPVLFHYAENDRYFSPRVTRYWYERFLAGGAPAEYVLAPRYGDDGHFLFADLIGVRRWLPVVEQFLASHGVPFQRLDSSLASKQPLFSATPPYAMTETCGGLYRVFLEAPGPRAYAVSPDGHCGFAGGVQNAREVALQQCGKVAAEPCELYADGEAVVWRVRDPNVMSAEITQR
jgi:dienelactone hydrolase